ncbi:MAG TPA: cobalt ABC transporter ATP-binding protein, partial [Clostridium sp.]|nr:cobalt ABC transporter ATP-binding protein [Clostridium sp.]
GRIIDFDVPEKIFSREDLLDYGVNYPSFTKICRELNIKSSKTGLYPITLEEAYDLVVKSNEKNYS